MSDIIKCLKCGNVLMSGSQGASVHFSPGSMIQCMKCGNNYIFGPHEPKKGEKK